jgi:hypothetical protein
MDIPLYSLQEKDISKGLIMQIIIVTLLSLFFLNQHPVKQALSLNTSSIYLHTDRSYYQPGDSIFFKAYLLDRTRSYQVNDTLVITLIDQEGLSISTGRFPLNNSQIAGNIDLPDYLTDGNYLLIAYSSPMTGLSSGNLFSKAIEIRNSFDYYLISNVELIDSLYKPGGHLKARIRFTSKGDKPVPADYNYQLTSSTVELLKGKGKAGEDGLAILDLNPVKFDKNATVQLLISSVYKGIRNVSGIIIPTTPQYTGRDIQPAAESSLSMNTTKQLNIRLEPTSNEDNKIRLTIHVTDNNGSPLMADLSVSASNIIPGQHPFENLNQDLKNIQLNTEPDIIKYSVEKLLEVTRCPGKCFIVQEKNNLKKLKKHKVDSRLKQDGYSSDRNIFDILQQIKPYHIENGKITFAATNMNSVNNLDGALIVVDGIKMGSDASILGSIPVPDIARITASNNAMDIQKYSAMNNCGVIEVFTKKAKEFAEKEENARKAKSSTLFWRPDIITDKTGSASLIFDNNLKSEEILISVHGVTASGLFGCNSIKYKIQ